MSYNSSDESAIRLHLLCQACQQSVVTACDASVSPHQEWVPHPAAAGWHVNLNMPGAMVNFDSGMTSHLLL